MAYVYILQSESRKYYIGSTVNLEERMKHHIGGHTPSTKRLGKIRLVLSQEYATLAIARQIENRLKKFKRRDYIEKIVKEGHIRIMPR